MYQFKIKITTWEGFIIETKTGNYFSSVVNNLLKKYEKQMKNVTQVELLEKKVFVKHD